MPTTSSTLDQQLTPLSVEEEELFLRIQSRLDAYFRDFYELEGFSVLATNLERLQRKVTLELRCVCYEYHDSFVVLQDLRTLNAALRTDVRRHQALCDAVIAEADAMKQRCQHAIENSHREMEKLHAFYSSQESLRQKQWRLESEKLRQEEMDTLMREHAAKLQAVEMEHEQQLEAMKKQVEAKKAAEIEYMEVQLRMQITSQVSRDLGKKLARQEKLSESYVDKMKQMQRRIDALQQELQRSRHTPQAPVRTVR